MWPQRRSPGSWLVEAALGLVLLAVAVQLARAVLATLLPVIVISGLAGYGARLAVRRRRGW